MINILQTYLAIRIGEIQFGPLDTCICILALGAALLSVRSLWRIAQHEDRQKRRMDALRRAPLQSAEPAQAPRSPWYQRLGTMVAATQIIGTAEQEKLLAALVAAGVKGHGHLAALIAAKVCSGASFVPLCWLFLAWRQFFVGAAALRSTVLAGGAEP